eukprot:c19401_g1_i1 orf=482-1813(-)
MMPGLIHNNILSRFAASSTSRGAESGAFPKPFNEARIYTDEASAGPSLNPPHGAKATCVFHTPALAQAMRVQSYLNPGAKQVSKVGVCGDRLVNTERMMKECVGSSGSNHEPSSMCLFSMVNEFIEKECVCGEAYWTPAYRTDSSNSMEESMSNGMAHISKSLQSLARCQNDQEVKVLRDVQVIVESNIAEADCSSHPCEDKRRTIPAHGCQKRKVMSGLQRIGYNAAICKTRWDHVSSIPGGDYEYIDVLFPSDSSVEPLRLVVDIDFQAQFEIARPSSEFSAALQLLSPIFVGRPERLRQIVHLMAELTKQSLCANGLDLPPWRKLTYTNAKWFSLYKRTSNNVASSMPKHNDARGGYTGIAVRGCGLDSRCTNELELLYHGLELFVRGGKGRAGKGKHSKERDESITVTMTEWQLPPVEMRPLSNSRKQRKVTGLASMLR